MCGIVGYINFNGLDRQTVRQQLERAVARISYRGPDASGVFVDDFAGLGHCRLSIIDLAGGDQPMHSQDQHLHLVFNGEIYNFPELRKELQSQGYEFQTSSDTEVILNGYHCWGEEVTAKLNGMFAFAIWDSSKQALFLARDRVGKKPLYYWSEGNQVVFASELKALLELFPGSPEIDPRALDCYFSFGYVPSPLSIYREIRKLKPAHQLSISRGRMEEKRYWSLRFAPDHNISEAEAREQFESLLGEATRCRLMSEVPLGAFLSGGLDSGLVVSAMAENMSQPVLTNSIGFGDRQHNELPLARLVADQFGCDHREFTLEADAAGVLPQIARHFDEPLADSSAVPTWYVCEMARQNVTVALSGDGGDEGFAGYTFRYNPHLAEAKLRAGIPMALRGLLFGPLGSLYPASARLPRYLRLKTIFENLAVSDAEAFYQDLVWLRADDRDALYSEQFKQLLAGYSPLEEVYPRYSSGQAPDPLSRAQYADIHFYMTEDVLVKVDRMSMAHSLEVRSPLLDHRVLEFAATLPTQLKVNAGKGKHLLRMLAKKKLPKDIVEHPKQGFSIPAARWLRGELKEMAQNAIFESRVIGDYLDPTQVQRMWDEHQSGNRDHNVFLWGLMMLGMWEEHARLFVKTGIR